MKKTLVASALATVLLIPAASATEIYSDDKNSVSIGGYMDARFMKVEGEKFQMVNGSTRINFAFERDMGDGWQTYSKFEWAINPFGTSELVYSGDSQVGKNTSEFLTNRIGLVGLAHDTYGSLTFGKQWGAWYDVVSATDAAIIFGSDMASGVYGYGDGGIAGTGRADASVQYRNSIGDLSFVVQAQIQEQTFEVCGERQECGPDEENGQSNVLAQTVSYDNTYGFAVTYSATDMLTLTAGYNRGEFDITDPTTPSNNTSEADEIYGIGASWGGFDDLGLFVAANINQQKNHQVDDMGNLIDDAYGIDTVASYLFDNSIRTFVGYQRLDADKDGDESYKFVQEFATAGAHYLWNTSAIFYVEAKYDLADTNDSAIGAGFRYFL